MRIQDLKGAALCGAVSGFFICYTGVSAAGGATAGAIGHSIMTAAGWSVKSISYTQFIDAMSFGSAVLSIPSGCCAVSELFGNGVGDESKKASSICKMALLSLGITGALDGMAGAGIIGLLSNSEQLSFTAATGATGTAVLVSSLTAGCCVLICCLGGNAYFCMAKKSGEPVMVRVPENVGDRVETFSPTQLGIPCTTIDEMVNFNNSLLLRQANNNVLSPTKIDDMQRDSANLPELTIATV